MQNTTFYMKNFALIFLIKKIPKLKNRPKGEEGSPNLVTLCRA
jgi:hypothetical protein